MAKQNINIGVSPNDGTGDPVRTAFNKAKGNFDELYARATGDMNKSTYDADNSGAVDAADKVTGVDAAGNVTYYGKDAAGVIGFHSFALDKVDAYADFASFPIAGFDDVIYIDKAAFVLYLWDDVNTIYKAVAGGVSQGYVDAKVEDLIVDGVLDKAPSQNAVFDALAGKANSTEVVQSVTGSAVDNTDPNNPVINITAAPKEHQINGTRITASVSSTYSLDWNAASVFDLTMTAATTFSSVNLPTGTNTKIIEILLTGAFTPTFPATWVKMPGSIAYNGAKINRYQVDCINGTGGSEKIYYDNRTTT